MQRRQVKERRYRKSKTPISQIVAFVGHARGINGSSRRYVYDLIDPPFEVNGLHSSFLSVLA